MSSFLNDRAQALNKASTVFGLTAQGQISFLLPNLRFTPLPLCPVTLSPSVICQNHRENKEKLKSSSSQFSVCLFFFFSAIETD